MNGYIDPEELPFTAEEVYRAAQTFLPTEAARRMADHLAECGPNLVAERARRRDVWRRGGIARADSMLLYGWVYPDALLPALAGLSSELRERVRALRRRLERDDRDAAV